MKLNLFLAFALTMPVAASPALRNWIERFPNVREIQGVASHNLRYRFFFRVHDFDVAIVLSAKVAPEVLKSRAYSELVHDGAITETKFMMYIHSARGAGNFSLHCDANEFLRLLNLIATHELFSLTYDKPQLEVRPIMLDSYWIVANRTILTDETIVEREAGTSVPVDDFVKELWQIANQRMQSMPVADQQTFAGLTER